MRTPLTTIRDYACAVHPSQALRELRRCTRLEVVSFRGCSRLTDQAVGFLMPMQALQLLCLDLALTPTPTLTLTLTLTRRCSCCVWTNPNPNPNPNPDPDH